MRVLAVLAHDNSKSLNAYLFNSVIKHLKDKNVDVDVLNLYDYADQIPFYTGIGLEENKFFQENKKRFMEADRLLIVYPVYWYGVPGILKSWVDLITNYAWKYEGGPWAKALHKIKKVLIINTSLAPVWFRKWYIGDLSFRQLKQSFRWMGIKDNRCYRIGNAPKLDDYKVASHMDSILLSLKCFIK